MISPLTLALTLAAGGFAGMMYFSWREKVWLERCKEWVRQQKEDEAEFRQTKFFAKLLCRYNTDQDVTAWKVGELN